MAPVEVSERQFAMMCSDPSEPFRRALKQESQC